MRNLKLFAFWLVVGLWSTAAWADYSVQGAFHYRDRGFGLSGYNGSQPSLPIREADVQVLDASTQSVLASGRTDQNGVFLINVVDSQTRSVSVRVLASSGQTSDLHLVVRNTDTSAIFAVAAPSFTNHAPTSNIDFTSTPVTAEAGVGGEAFNIWNNVVDGLSFIGSLNGGRPGAGQSLTVFWALLSANGTFYQDADRSIHLFGLPQDSDGYDDSVILHELGHYVEFVLADSDNPTGAHSPSSCLDVRLAWSEGYSTFFQNMVRRWQGIARPEIYVDTTGQLVLNNAFIGYDVEIPSTGIPGSGNEVSVNAALWDIIDGPAELDTTPGIDDDNLNLADGPARYWDVHKNYIPTVANINLEDFWDGWLIRGHGSAVEMQDIFNNRNLRYFSDSFEPDNGPSVARDGGFGNVTTEHSIYTSLGTDEDWTRFGLTQGKAYTFETLNLPCGSNTSMELVAANGVTVLAFNDDKSFGNPASRINYTAATTADVFLRIFQPANFSSYTTYDLVTTGDFVVAITEVQIQTTATGVLLTWEVDSQDNLSHFDVQRSDLAAGPFSRINTEAIDTPTSGSRKYEYLDQSVEAGEKYYYRLVGVGTSGELQVFGPYEAIAAVPFKVSLHAVHPNPFNPNASLAFDLPKAGDVTLKIFDVRGHSVRTLLQRQFTPAGTRILVWNGKNDEGRDLGSGVYFVRMDALGQRLIQRAVLVR